MKKLILPLVMFFLIMSCEDENPQPVQVIDPFVGSWEMVNNDLELEVSFDVRQNGDELQFHNINIDYPEITEALDYRVELYYRFAVNAGYKKMQVIGGGDQEWIILNMYHTRIHLKTPDTLRVYMMGIHMVNRDSIPLENQVFVKAN